MGRRLVCELEEPTAEEQCHHRWIIEFPEGPTSRGVCQRCGAEREFTNYIEYSRWEEDYATEFQGFATLDTKPDQEPADATEE